ncbi:alpha/beta fold hydrolase [Brachybacterium sacelli]|uniref:Pimeloyl-ACP methyl ester carboxylesterase n=1 Tax=Brachybacterium sacelli TaxID=173364 RepID=A0ABS4WZ85_9MICO|nr:alpha/beta hydrolase [Brachybacterium sacelli]MBP2381278.1 pimeloyl-ACP methyl ester carboxylesterase [Brachybacterium sacelli]
MSTATTFTSYEDLTVLGGPVRVHRAGESGTPVLLLHGAMLDTAEGIWHDVVPSLSADHRVYVIDMPRHGASRPWKGWLGDAFYGRFLLALLDVLELDTVAIMGLSMGGGVGFRFALRHPERVSALIPVNPGGLGEKRPHHFLTWAIIRTPGMLRACSWILAHFPGYLRSGLASSLDRGTETPGLDRIVRLAGQEAREKHRFGERAMDDWQLDWYGPLRTRFGRLEELRALKVPTLWMHGADDPLIGHHEMAAAHEATPDSRFVTIAHAGHLLPYDQPEQLGMLARDFLTESGGGRGEN